MAAYKNISRQSEKIPDLESVTIATDRYVFLTYTRVLDVMPDDVMIRYRFK